MLTTYLLRKATNAWHVVPVASVLLTECLFFNQPAFSLEFVDPARMWEKLLRWMSLAGLARIRLVRLPFTSQVFHSGVEETFAAPPLFLDMEAPLFLFPQVSSRLFPPRISRGTLGEQLKLARFAFFIQASIPLYLTRIMSFLSLLGSVFFPISSMPLRLRPESRVVSSCDL